jgi:membrane-bound ClpP family serine protease
MPVWLPSDSATVLNPILSAILLLVGIAALVVVFRLGPKAERISLD